jgi:hypothetical protein
MQPAGYVNGRFLGWDELVSGEVDSHVIPGYRETMFERPGVRYLARALQGCLDDMDGRNEVGIGS